jgi:hypothetical protein
MELSLLTYLVFSFIVYSLEPLTDIEQYVNKRNQEYNNCKPIEKYVYSCINKYELSIEFVNVLSRV